jgi:hypothetical protein
LALDIQGLRESVGALDDRGLLDGFGEWVGRDRRVTAALLIFLVEIDRRGAYAGTRHSSLFGFCVEELHMSESSAGKRIHAARAAARFPVLFDMVARGEMHLSGINRLAPHLTEENLGTVLSRARHMSTRQIEKLVAEIAPEPERPSRVRALPRRDAAPLLTGATAAQHAEERAPAPSPTGDCEPAGACCAGYGAVAAAIDGAECARRDGDAPFVGGPAGAGGAADVVGAAARGPASTTGTFGQVRPVAPRRYRVELTIGEETYEKLRALQGLLPDRDAAAIFDRAIGELLDRTLARKAAITDRPRPRRDDGERGRKIPAQVRRDVWMRDGGRCAFVASDGQRCRETARLEFHHRVPYARGGPHAAENVEMRCRAHNQHAADLDFGRDFMEAKRGRGGARETLAPYRLVS